MITHSQTKDKKNAPCSNTGHKSKENKSLNILKHSKVMINSSSNQKLDPSTKVLAISKTLIPLDYDKTSTGFNEWTDYIRNELHVNSQPFTVHSVVYEATKVLNFHKSPTNVRKR